MLEIISNKWCKRLISGLIIGSKAIFITSLPAHADINSKSHSCIDHTVVYFVNGIKTDLDEAKKTTAQIELAYKEEFEKKYKNKTIEFKYSHNRSNGAFEDIIEVIYQKYREDYNIESKSPLEDIKKLRFLDKKALTKYRIGTDTVTIDQESIKDFITVFKVVLGPLVAEVIGNLTPLAFENEIQNTIANVQETERQDLMKMIRAYKDDLSNGKKVLLIAHSQGNLYANQAVKKLKEFEDGKYKNSISLIGVGSPAKYNRKLGSFPITAGDDEIINILREDTIFAVEDRIVKNDNPKIARDSLNHLFLESYFKEKLKSREKINKLFWEQIKKLKSTCKLISTDLHGIWKIHDGSLVLITETDKEITSNYIKWVDKAINHKIIEDNNSSNFEAKRKGKLIEGKISTMWINKEARNKCPKPGDGGKNPLILKIKDENTLEGEWSSNQIDPKNCKILKPSKKKIPYTHTNKITYRREPLYKYSQLSFVSKDGKYPLQKIVYDQPFRVEMTTPYEVKECKTLIYYYTWEVIPNLNSYYENEIKVCPKNAEYKLTSDPITLSKPDPGKDVKFLQISYRPYVIDRIIEKINVLPNNWTLDKNKMRLA